MSIDLEESVLPKYRYPSGGSLYPVQTYVWIRKVEGLKEGLYYYHPRDHKLFLLFGSDTDDLSSLSVLSEPTK
jgi:SagB-type dehydrogenase family enzyme